MGIERNKEDIIIFGKQLRTMRKQSGLSQQDLAYLMDVEVSQISRIERGVINTSLSTILSIAKALDIHPSLLFV